MITVRSDSRARSRLVARLIAVGLTVATVAACGSDDGTDSASAPTRSGDGEATASRGGSASELEPQPLEESVSLTVAIPARIAVMGNVLLAEELGEFERENLDVEVLSVPSSDSLPQLASGDIDFAVVSFQASLFNAINEGFDIKLIAPLYHGQGGNLDGLYVRNDLLDDAPESLRGESIVSIAGLTGSPTLPIGDYLAEGDVDVSEVEASRVPTEALLPALESEEAAAAWLLSPIPPGVDEVATRVTTFTDGETLAGVMAGPTRLEGDPAVVEAFLRAIARTVGTYMQGDYYSDPAVVEALAAATGAPESTFVPGEELVWSPTLEMAPGEPVDRLQEHLLQIPDLLTYDEPIPSDELIDASYLESLGLG